MAAIDAITPNALNACRDLLSKMEGASVPALSGGKPLDSVPRSSDAYNQKSMMMAARGAHPVKRPSFSPDQSTRPANV